MNSCRSRPETRVGRGQTLLSHSSRAISRGGGAGGRGAEKEGLKKVKEGISLLSIPSPTPHPPPCTPVPAPMQVVCQAAPSGSLPAGSLTGGEADGVRYSPGQIAWLGPREQPRLTTEFVSPVRARGGRLAGLVEPPARNAARANVAQRGPIRWPTPARQQTPHAEIAERLGAARRGGLGPGVERRATAWHGGPDVAEATPAL